jgi:hypothetical protein
MILITQLSENYGEKKSQYKDKYRFSCYQCNTMFLQLKLTIRCFSSSSLQYDVSPPQAYNTMFLQLKLKYLKLYPCRVEKCYNPAKGEFVVNYRRTEIGRNTHAEI